ncbi:transposase [Sphingomonas sp. RHCKR7]|uniref:transposase n=1 Tax=Sphingomonas folli TaxID=2862497 RepID=UPI001CA4C3B7|nr:transposase [Sphingomonas folli]MBW6528239.1 transposase [Sphingomonas folli]
MREGQPCAVTNPRAVRDGPAGENRPDRRRDDRALRRGAPARRHATAFPNKAVVEMAGLAPLADHSGQRHGARAIRGGRASVGSILFLVAHVAREYDSDLAAFRDRLLAQGQPNMVVRLALARTLLVRLNAVARETRLALASST